MSPIDKESIHSKIARIRKNLKELRKIARISYEDYTRDDITTAASERLIHVSIEAMLDIGSHIIAQEAVGEPVEYRDVFKLLVHAGILPKDKEVAFINLAGLRNRIVHLYDEIDHKKLHQALQSGLNDFDDFLRAITEYLAR